ncbi:MAG: DEAD/DEAH box helicase [Planctomycetia bacterium]|nr:DEAD/DEAH box helicase [Planctomycetia bacterium]
MDTTTTSPVSVNTFSELGLTDLLLRALAAEGYTVPTPIQTRAVPPILAGRDLIGCAQTGTGKTAAFALPLIEQMLATPRKAAPRRCRTLVLAPTRELAGQILEGFNAYGRFANLSAAVIYGGVSQRPQATALQRGVDVLVATPGRLLDLVGQRLVDLRTVEFLVLDEADRMLDMGFIQPIRKIIGMLPTDRQTLLFSATLPAEVRSLANDFLRDPLEIKTAPQATPADTVTQSVYFVSKAEKKAKLVELLRGEASGRVIVFTRTKHGADKLHRDLDKAGIAAAAIHGNKSQNQRERALAAFKSPRPPVLIATDIAARGIDVDEVSHVVNYELPHEPETYVHRIGRTGRAGLTGAAVSFCDHEERPRLAAIERLLRRAIPQRNEPPAWNASMATESDRGGGRGEGRPSRGRGQGRGQRTAQGNGQGRGRPQGGRGAGLRREGRSGSEAPKPEGAATATATAARKLPRKHRRAL